MQIFLNLVFYSIFIIFSGIICKFYSIPNYSNDIWEICKNVKLYALVGLQCFAVSNIYASFEIDDAASVYIITKLNFAKYSEKINVKYEMLLIYSQTTT